MKDRRTKVWALLVLVGVFLAGALSGTGATLLVVRHKVRTLLEAPAGELETRGLVLALDRRLRLTDTQRAQVEAIHRKHLPELNRVRRQSEPELATIRAQASREIRAVLTPEQQPEFDEMARKFEERRRQMTEP
jgi:Spy/CpxP family protein refolding chaperone